MGDGGRRLGDDLAYIDSAPSSVDLGTGLLYDCVRLFPCSIKPCVCLIKKRKENNT